MSENNKLQEEAEKYEGEYKIIVEFSRSLTDDVDNIAYKKGKDAGELVKELISQFAHELQDAYDNGDLAGSFQVTKVELIPIKDK